MYLHLEVGLFILKFVFVAMPTDFHWDLKHLYILFTLSLSAPSKSVPERKSRLTCHVLETLGITKVGNFHFGNLWFLRTDVKRRKKYPDIFLRHGMREKGRKTRIVSESIIC